jgi:hypothetical protein
MNFGSPSSPHQKQQDWIWVLPERSNQAPTLSPPCPNELREYQDWFHNNDPPEVQVPLRCHMFLWERANAPPSWASSYHLSCPRWASTAPHPLRFAWAQCPLPVWKSLNYGRYKDSARTS